MGNSRIVDILPPYEDEILFSWVVRMLRYYDSGDLKYSSKMIMGDLFGENVSVMPGLYYQEGLHYFVANSNMNKSEKFKSVKEIVNRMTIIPFYRTFLTYKEQLQTDEIFSKNKKSK